MLHRGEFDEGAGGDSGDGKDNEDDEFEVLYKMDLKPRRVTFGEPVVQSKSRGVTPALAEPKLVVTEIIPDKPKFTVNHEHYDFDAPADFIFTSLDAISTTKDKGDGDDKESKPSLEKITRKHSISYFFDCGLPVQRYGLWRLKFTSKKDSKTGERYIDSQLSLQEIRWPNPEDTLKLSCILQLIDNDQAIVTSQLSGRLEFGKSKSYPRKFSFTRFVSYDEIMKNKDRLLGNKVGKGAHFHLQMDLASFVPKKEESEFKRLYIPKKTLETSDMLYGNLWREKTPDVKIVAGGKSFMSHKGLLEARSPVLARLLANAPKMADDVNKNISTIEPGTPTKSTLLKFDNIGSDTMESVLEYMYTGQVNIVGNFDKVKELYRLADEYRIYFFKKHLLSTLDNALTVENVTEVMEFAAENDTPPDVYDRIIAFCEKNFEKPDNLNPTTEKTGNLKIKSKPKIKKSTGPKPKWV